MERPVAEFFYDYSDPASYLVDLHLREAADRVAVAVAPRPFELRPTGRGIPDETWEEVRARAAEAGLEWVRPAVLPRTRKAHELALHARSSGVFLQVHDAIFRALWEEGRDIGRVDVLVEIGTAAGLERAGTKVVLDVDRFAPEVAAERRRAERLGVEGVPTLRAGGQTLQGFRPAGEILTFLRRAARG